MAKDKYIVHNPLSGLELPKYKPTKKRAYTVEQMAGILSKAPERYRTLFYLYAETGLLAGEVAGLEVRDVNLANRMIGVSRAVWRGHEDSPKTDAGVRKFAISARLAKMLAKEIGGRTSGPAVRLAERHAAGHAQCLQPCVEKGTQGCRR